MKEPEPLKYIPFEDREVPGDWRVEAIDTLTGDCYVSIFMGPDAEYRANEYAAFKNGKHPLIKPAQQVDPKAVEKIKIIVQGGKEITLYLSGLVWSWNSKRKTVTAKQKEVMELSSSKGQQ